jgi:carbon-monoxide dehydrogenase medium subunit
MVTFVEPETVWEAAELARTHEWDGKFVSGGTALVLMMQQRLVDPEVLISLRALRDEQGWSTIGRTGTHVRIGAGATLTDVARSEQVRHQLPSLAYAASVVGNLRVRNVATLGGNVAESDYASDPPAVLVDLDAEFEAKDGNAVRLLPAAEMFTDFYTNALATGEIITAVHVPLPGPSRRSSYLKFCSRSAEDRPCVGVASSLEHADGAVESLSVVLGAVSGIPQRWPEVTASVVGMPLDSSFASEVADQYADLVDPLDDARGSAAYRRDVVRVLVRRSIEANVARETGAGDV